MSKFNIKDCFHQFMVCTLFFESVYEWVEGVRIEQDFYLKKNVLVPGFQVQRP